MSMTEKLRLSRQSRKLTTPKQQPKKTRGWQDETTGALIAGHARRRVHDLYQ